MRLKDRVAIITGAGYGIGKAYASAFAVEGAKVVAADIDLQAAEATAREIKAKGGQASALRVDVSDWPSVQEMARKVVEAFGRIDVLINNAALYADITVKPWDEVSVEEWDRVLAVNLRGSFLCAKAVAPYMKRQKSGKIINVGSGTVLGGVRGRVHYTVSKAGVIGLTRVLARELGDFNINVNSIFPGLTYTGRGAHPEERYKEGAQARCIKRIEYPEDLVGTAIFLSSKESDFITGQTINVDGGERFV